MGFGKAIARAKGMLAAPRAEWPLAAAEPASTRRLYTDYIVWIAALPAIASFIKHSIINAALLGVLSPRMIGAGLGAIVLGYLLTLLLVYVVALVINTLSVTFNAQKDMVQALKTTAYACTAYWIAGIAVIIPWIGWPIMLLGGVYSIYLLYLGLTHAMKCPPEKAGGYTALSVIVAFILSSIVSIIVLGIVGTAALTGAAMTSTHLGSTRGDHATVDPDSALGWLATMDERAAQAVRSSTRRRSPGDSSIWARPRA